VGGGEWDRVINIGRATRNTANQGIFRAIVSAYGVNFDDKMPASRSRLDIKSKRPDPGVLAIYVTSGHKFFKRKSLQ
jgi:hypothetical protein